MEFIVAGIINSNRIRMAKKLAILFHGNQKYGSHKYYYHLYSVFKYASKKLPIENELELENLQIGCLLHDILEDTICPKFLIRILFGKNISNAVSLVSKSKPYNPSKYFENISKNVLASKIKVADRIVNISESKINKNKKMLSKYEKEEPYFKWILFALRLKIIY